MSVTFEQIEDKQRIVIVGSSSTDDIIQLIIHTLSINRRQVAWQLANDEKEIASNAPFIIIQKRWNDTIENTLNEILDLQHHLLIIHDLPKGAEEVAEKLTLATPKAGVLFFPEKNEEIKKIAEPHASEDLKIEGYAATEVLSLEKVAAKVLMRKIGITEAIFEQALATYKP